MKDIILREYAKYWNDITINEDIDICRFESYLNPNTKYISQMLSEDLIGKEMILEYLLLKGKTVLKSNTFTVAEIGRVNEADCVIIYQHSIENIYAVVLFEVENDTIVSIDMCIPELFDNLYKTNEFPNSYLTYGITRLNNGTLKESETVRSVIRDDFKIDLPIKGGWGYSLEDSVIIDKNDITVNRNMPFDGVSLEYIFVEKRLYEELIIFREKGCQFADIEWELETQSLRKIDNKSYDVLEFNVSAIQDGKEKYIKRKRTYWFDITSFFGI